MPLFGSSGEKGVPQRVLDTIKASKTSHKLNLADERLDSLPKAMFKSSITSGLKVLDVSSNALDSLPSLAKLTSLTSLNVASNALTVLPDSIGALTALTRLDVHNNTLGELPESLGNLTRLALANFSHNGLPSLPSSFGSLVALKELELNDNALDSLPPSIAALADLRLLDLSNNALTQLPRQIGSLTALKDLSVKNNQLASLPPQIGNLGDLRILNVAGNNLDTFPQELAALQGTLAIIDLQGNPLRELPPAVRSVPTAGLLHYLETPDDNASLLLSPSSTNRISAFASPSYAPQDNHSSYEYDDGASNDAEDDGEDGESDDDTGRGGVMDGRDGNDATRVFVSYLDGDEGDDGDGGDGEGDEGGDGDGDGDGDGGDGDTFELSSLSRGTPSPRIRNPYLEEEAEYAFSTIKPPHEPRELVSGGAGTDGYVVLRSKQKGGDIDREATMSRISAAFEAARSSPNVALSELPQDLSRPQREPPLGVEDTRLSFGPRQHILRPSPRSLRSSNSLLSSTLSSPGGRRGTRSAVLSHDRVFARDPKDFLSSLSFSPSPFPVRGSSPPPPPSPLATPSSPPSLSRPRMAPASTSTSSTLGYPYLQSGPVPSSPSPLPSSTTRPDTVYTRPDTVYRPRLSMSLEPTYARQLGSSQPSHSSHSSRPSRSRPPPRKGSYLEKYLEMTA